MKWEGTLSNPIVIKQGVRQGGVLSTMHYKRYNNPRLIQLENKFTAAKIGYIRIPRVTVADDLTMTSNSLSEMQVMYMCTYLRQLRQQSEMCDSSDKELYPNLLGPNSSATKRRLYHER